LLVLPMRCAITPDRCFWLFAACSICTFARTYVHLCAGVIVCVSQVYSETEPVRAYSVTVMVLHIQTLTPAGGGFQSATIH
jgi:hypothetical protein